MNFSKMLQFAVIWTVFGTGPAILEAKAAEPATSPATEPIDQQLAPILVQASDSAGVKSALDKDVFLEGTIAAADWSGSGKVMKATFKDADSGVQVIVFEKKHAEFDAAFNGNLCKTLIGARVRFTGRLKDYKGSPELVLDRVSQITIYDPALGPETKRK